ncbi:MAG: DNA repair protein RecN [Lachnospiraceae bacterium]|nr:DNA repair protein RecN [Lachnospiraceae bacterium]
MLSTIHVKNFALIDEANVELGAGLNILTGETGAGKSILIDAVNAALGGKVSRDIIGKHGDHSLIELIFVIDDPGKVELLNQADIYPEEDGTLILSRRITENRNVCKINDETVTLSRLKSVTGLLIDIHGQHEHQSLLHRQKHLEILDEFAVYKVGQLKEELAESYRRYRKSQLALSQFEMDEDKRLREMDFLQFEIREIEDAHLKEGEEEELAAQFKRMNNAGKIVEKLQEVLGSIGYDGRDSAGEQIDRSLRIMSPITGFDETIEGFYAQLEDADSILSGLCREINDYLGEMSFDSREMQEIENRLDTIRSIQAKYGADYTKVMESLEEKRARLNDLEAFEERKAAAAKLFAEAKKETEELSAELSEIRKVEAYHLTEAIRTALVDLNFLEVQFSMEFGRAEQLSANGYDEMEFLISTNPGEELKPLGLVASGGELSRIMLAIKAVLADVDQIDTLIFDEIDTGISGRTAQKVSEKLNYIGRSHQVICITHLPQIAAMADNHYRIEKSVVNGRTVTRIDHLTAEQEISELARILGGAVITDTVLDSAREMKELAGQKKQYK